MQTVAMLKYAQLKAASYFMAENRNRLATAGISINPQGHIEAANGSMMVRIPSNDAKAIDKALLIRPQGRFPTACDYVILYRTKDEGVGYMRGYTSSGVPIQQGGFDRLIPVLFLDARFPNVERIIQQMEPLQAQQEIAFDAAQMLTVSKAVQVLTGGRTTQVRMRLTPRMLQVSDTRDEFCSVYLRQIERSRTHA